MAKIRLTTPHFIEPDYFKADTVIDFQGSYKSMTPFMEPLDKEAQDLMDKYYKENPKATISSPVDALPRTMAVAIPAEEPKAVNPIVRGK